MRFVLILLLLCYSTSIASAQKVHVDFDNKSVTYSNNKASGTKALDKAGKVIETSQEAPAGPIPTFNKSFLENGNSITINMAIDAPNRLVWGAPAINYEFSITITPSADKKSFNFSITGTSDAFPAYELWVQDVTNKKSYLLLNSSPTKTGETPLSLFPIYGDYEYNVNGNSNTQTSTEKVNIDDKPNTPESE